MVEEWARKMCGASPLVALFGHRQVGKTSLAERLASSYHTLDDRRNLNLAMSDPEGFLSGIADRHHTVVIDECQLAPPLFPALKEWVRTHQRPGQFLLTGSVRFSSRKVIKESLTGRLINVVIPPLGSAELCESTQPRFLQGLLKHGLSRAPAAPSATALLQLKKSLARYELTGGLPGTCFLRDEHIRAGRFESQIETILDRDLRLLLETSLPFVTLRRVLAELAACVGEPLNLSNLHRRTRVSPNTLRKLLYAFESMFLIELVPYHQGAGQPSIFFVDSGEAHHLAAGRLSPEQSFAQCLFSDLKATLSNVTRMPTRVEITHFRTRGGTNIPLVLTAGKKSFGFLPVLPDMPFSSVLGQTKSFLQSENAQGIVAVRRELEHCVRRHERLIEVPHAYVGA
jgi:predicted AAA+ superfamily ATPase